MIPRKNSHASSGGISQFFRTKILRSQLEEPTKTNYLLFTHPCLSDPVRIFLASGNNMKELKAYWDGKSFEDSEVFCLQLGFPKF